MQSLQDHHTRYQYTSDTQEFPPPPRSSPGVFLEARTYLYIIIMFHRLTLTRLNLLQRAIFLHPSICLSIFDTSVMKFSKTSSLWVPRSNRFLFGNGELVLLPSKVCRRLSRSCSFTANTFHEPTFQIFDPEF